jgi:multicomponent Na+:H+ antiporter subunit D
VIVAGSLLAAGYVFLVLRAAFVQGLAERPLRPIPRRLETTAFALALVAIALGLWASEPLALIYGTVLAAP